MLRNHVIYGHSYTFQTDTHPELLFGAEVGDKIRAGYVEWPTGSMGLHTLVYSGATTITGTVTALTGSSLTVQSASGQVHVLDTTLVGELLGGVQTGAGVQVTYSRDIDGRLVPHALDRHQSTPATRAAGHQPAGPHSGADDVHAAPRRPGLLTR